MYFKSKKISLLILGVTSVVCSRTMLLLIDDPEGPNLLVVMVLAGIVFLLSLAVYFFNPPTKSWFEYISFSSLSGLKRLLVVVFVQIIIVTALYFLSEMGF